MKRSALLLVPVLMLALLAAPSVAHGGGELRLCLRAEPKTFNPLLVEEEASETVRYLTGGVLVRLNRKTQQLEPELAISWKVSEQGRKIAFVLRRRLAFSDGTPFTAADVAFTIRQMMDPNLHSPTGDSFRSDAGPVKLDLMAPDRIAVTFPAAVAGLAALFDQVAIMSANSPKKEMAVLGPFYVADYKPGSSLLLKRNPNYWKRDSAGNPLPYLDAVRLDIQQNRELEVLRFRRGEVHLINSIDAEILDRFVAEKSGAAYDSGVSLDSEQMWFNQVAAAPLPDYKKAWFRSRNFRRAVSEAISRSDLCRVVFNNHAKPAAGPVSPANQFWFNHSLQPHPYDPKSALARLEQDGFRLTNGVLRDSGGHAVEFSIVTNSGNKSRERMATMIQQDLSKIGVKVNIVPLDFPSLIERIARTFNYEACLLGLVNNELDPNSQMNVWLSSAPQHQWNPSQKSPATKWEAEVDRLMRLQASSLDVRKRKAAWDRVQQIAWEEEPFIYLVNKNSLSLVSPSVRGVTPVVLHPQTYWNAEYLAISGGGSGAAK